MKYIQWIFLFLFLSLGTLACAPDVPPKKTAKDTRPVRSSRPTPEPETSSVADLNHLIGRWQLTRVYDGNLDSSLRMLRNLLSTRSSVIWTFEADFQGTLAFSNFAEDGSPVCQAVIEFTHSYCCTSMHRLFVNKSATSITVTPPGCLDAQWIWDHEIDDTYHFIYDSAEAMTGQVLLQGPYRGNGSASEFSHSLQLEKLED